MKSKIVIYSICLFICNNMFSQEIRVDVVQNSLGMDYMMRDYVIAVRLSKVVEDSYGEKYIGSFFLFDNWENSSIVKLKGKDFRLSNVNFNVENNEFMSEIGRDSVFTVAPKYIDLITINDKKYKYQFYKDEYKFFEVLYDSKENFSLFKGYNIRIIPKSTVGMLNRPYDEVLKDEKIYVLKESKLINLKLKKKEILKFFIEENMRNSILKFVRDNDLSYKKEKDVVKIFKYYDTF